MTNHASIRNVSLEERLRAMAPSALDSAEVADASRSFVGFMTLLLEIDAGTQKGWDDDERNGSGHRVREAEGRPGRIRKRRSR